MSLFSWFKKSEKHPPPSSMPSSSGLSRMESTKPFNAAKHGHGGPNGQPANRKNERMARRELLYGVVREAMVKAGVLTSSYKFKVLSLDSRGRQFLVMVDLAHGAGAETSRLAEIEAMVAQAAKTRFDIIVTAIYWRSNDHVAVGDPVLRPHASNSRPAPLEPSSHHESPSQPAELHAAPSGKTGQPDPLLADEVAAFKSALARGASNSEAIAAAHAAGGGSAKHGPQSYTLLTGFEDTELAPDPDTPTSGALSATQYGDLR